MRVRGLLVLGLFLSQFLVWSQSSLYRFKINYNSATLYEGASENSGNLTFKSDTLLETDIIKFYLLDLTDTELDEYELHIKVANTSVDHTFINDIPKFALNMGWFIAYKNRMISVYFHHIRIAGNSNSKEIYKVLDLFIEDAN